MELLLDPPGHVRLPINDGGWERSGNHECSEGRSAALDRSLVRGFTCGNMVGDLVAGMWMHSWGQGVAGSNPAVPTQVKAGSGAAEPARWAWMGARVRSYRLCRPSGVACPARAGRWPGGTGNERVCGLARAPSSSAPVNFLRVKGSLVQVPPSQRRQDGRQATASLRGASRRYGQPLRLLAVSIRRHQFGAACAKPRHKALPCTRQRYGRTRQPAPGR